MNLIRKLPAWCLHQCDFSITKFQKNESKYDTDHGFQNESTTVYQQAVYQQPIRQQHFDNLVLLYSKIATGLFQLLLLPSVHSSPFL